MSEFLMPDGYKSLHEILSRPTSRKDGIMIVDAQPLLLLLEITKEMAEALEECAVVFYEAGTQITEEDLKRPHIFRHDFTNFKIIEEHNKRAFKAIEVLEKFRKWK